MTQNTSSSSIARRGFMLVLSSPSGAGKTTIARKVLESEDELVLSISVTTRPKRSSEKEGSDYFFVDEGIFSQMVDTKQFLEHAQVYGYYYGTPRATIEELLAMGTDVLFDIDWQGTQQLKQTALNDLVSVFILPPTIEDLEKRLYTRGEDSEEVVRKRMRQAQHECSHWAEYDYVIINEALEESIQKVRSIVQAERLKRRRQIGLVNFVNRLRETKK
ncbi:MAG: guanylate kinase [Alphaproteobacteria bacterium]|nr:guanylate kinase [Alphaproteobacteria bacterium]